MKCKKCGAEIPAGAATCPECGMRAEKKKLSRGATIGISAVLIVIVIALFAVILVVHNKSTKSDANQATDTSATGETARTDDTATTTDTETADTQDTDTSDTTTDSSTSTYTPAEGSYTVAESDVTDDMLQAVVAEWGDAKLTNEQLAYYYWQGIRSFISTYADYIGNFLDVSQPLDGQYYDSDNEITWQSYFLDMAVSNFSYYSALNESAEEAGFTLPSNYEAYLESLGDTLAENVTEYGYTDTDSYLRAVFGPYATLEGYTEFNRVYLTAMLYASAVQSSLTYTDEQISEFFEENADSFASSGISQDGTTLISVRHILIQPDDTDSEDDWTAAEQEANDIYETWKNNPTEDYFAQLAETYSEDTGSSSNGGLYEEVYPGEMVETFNDWCFDSSRQPGDTGIVKTDYGYHIMYFVDHGEEYWHYCAKNSMMSSDWSTLESQMTSAHETVTHYDQAILVDPVGMYS